MSSIFMFLFLLISRNGVYMILLVVKNLSSKKSMYDYKNVTTLCLLAFVPLKVNNVELTINKLTNFNMILNFTTT